MEVTEREMSGVKVLGVAGKMMGGPDETALSDMIGSLAEQGKSRVVLDLSELTWMNSRGLGICIGGLTRLRSSGGDLRLAAVPRVVGSIIEKCNLQTIFRIFPTVEEAVKSF
jgi:anti-sigma B factor antagonist